MPDFPQEDCGEVKAEDPKTAAELALEWTSLDDPTESTGRLRWPCRLDQP